MVRLQSSKTSFYLACISSGILTSIYVLVDSIALNSLISDPIAYGYFTIMGGLLISVALWLLLGHIPLKQKHGKKRVLAQLFESDFKPNFKIPKKVFYYVMIASLFNGGGMTLYFIASQSFDPSLILPLLQFTVVYLLIGEFLVNKDLPTIVEVLTLTMITLGAIIATINPEMDIDILVVLLTLGPLNIMQGLTTFFQKKAASITKKDGSTVDSLTLRLWMVIGLTIVFGVLGLPLAVVNNSWIVIQKTFVPGMLIAALSMSITFFAYALYLRSLATGKTYIVNAIVSISVVTSVPLTLMSAMIAPTIFGAGISLDPFTWILKSIGSILIFVGIIGLAMFDSRGYILIKSKVGYVNTILEEVIKIEGVTTVAVVFGEWDLLLNYRIRSTNKLLKLIIRKIAAIEGVEKVTTQMIIKIKENP